MSTVRPITAQTGNTIDTDILIIGSGLAGLLLALKLCHGAQYNSKRIVLVAKERLADSNSSWAQGGVAAVTGANPFDSPEAHYLDTIKSGAGLTDALAARAIVDGGARLIEELVELGVSFDKSGTGKLDLALEGGHKQARVIHNKDTTGLSITSALCNKLREAQAQGLITILEDTTAIDLLIGNVGRVSSKAKNRITSNAKDHCYGAKLLIEGDNSDTSSFVFAYATHTILATGGLGQIYERTTNPLVATGDGIALAYRAGAQLIDMEFVQFHPTALRVDNAPAFLISEAVRGAGATLLDHKGERFAQRYHPDGELATRDVVSRAIHAVMSEHNLPNVYLDLRPIGKEAILAKFPNIVATCLKYGINVLTEPVPVAPAAHYMMGGIKTTTAGQTTVPGLFAIGECACTGLHGANRLASNSLLEAGVMALNLSDELARDGNLTVVAKLALHGRVIDGAQPSGPVIVPANLQNFQKQMYRQCGMVRSRTGLEAIMQSKGIPVQKAKKAHYAARNILQVGQLIAQAALLRQESRGSHLRDDFAQINDNLFTGHFILSQSGASWISTVVADPVIAGSVVTDAVPNSSVISGSGVNVSSPSQAPARATATATTAR